jgi:eukaryotic-like serine/threonine-protein kinase
MACLNDETMAAIADGTLAGEERRAAIGHVDECASCRQVLAGVLTLDGPAPPPGEPRRTLAAGETIGRYVVLECIGSGSMGIVYTGQDPDLGRRVALKVLRSDSAGGSTGGARRRLLREAQAMARLSHPNVVAIYDVGMHGDEVFLAMELIDGGTLREWLRRARRSWREVVGVFRRAGEGLAAAHAVGLVHRDFKPDNVLVGNDGRVCVTDFGLARPASTAVHERLPEPPPQGIDSMTRTGAIVGTPAYMAPEQIEGGAADERSDLFAFCVAFYEALYGDRPFTASHIVELAGVIARGQIPPPPAGARVPSWLRRMVVRGLRAAPSERYAGVAALCDAIDRGLSRRRRAAVVAVAVAVVAVAIALWPSGPSEPSGRDDGAVAAAAQPSAPRPMALTDHPLPASTSDEAVRAYRRGLKNQRDGIAPAHDFARALELDPSLAEAHLRFALDSFWQVPVEARAHLATAIELRGKLGPRDQMLLTAAQAWMQNQPADRNAYAKLLREAHQAFPLDAELAFQAGKAAWESDDPSAAFALFERALELDPAYGAAYRSTADLLAYAGKLDEALAVVERCTRQDPDATTCLAQRTLIDGLEGNCTRLEQDAQRILAHDPRSDVGYFLLASASYSQGRSLEAVRELLRERVARLPDALKPRFETWHRWAFDVLTGDFDAARERARELERTTAPDADRRLHARAAYWWTSASLESGRAREAATGAQAFLERKDAWMAEPRGEDFSILRDLTPRLLLAERIGGVLTPDAFEAERAKWIELWEKSVVPGSRPFLWLHGHAAVVETRADAERALAQAPRFGIPRYTPFTLGDAFIGTTYFLAGQTATALPYLERAARSCVALEVPFEHTHVQLVLGQALASVGRRDDACAAYAVVLARWGDAKPRSITADRARSLAKDLGCR